MKQNDRGILDKLENLQNKLTGVITTLKKNGSLSKEYEDQFKDFFIYIIKSFVTGRME